MPFINLLGRRARLGFLLACTATAALMAAVAFASDTAVSVADVTAPTGSVTLAPGGSGPIDIKVTVTGNQVGTATFKVNRDWTLSGGSFSGSNPQTFTVNPRASGDAPNVFTTTGTVTVAAGEAAATKTLTVQVFDVTNTNTTGAKLNAGTAGIYSVTVDNTPPADTATPTDASVVINSGDAWTNDADGKVSLALSANDNVGVTSYKLATTLAGLTGATPVPVSPAAKAFSTTVSGFALGGDEGAAKEVFFQACDAANNCSTGSDTIGWDKTNPSVDGTVTSTVAYTDGNGAKWYKDTVAGTWSASDILSDIATGPTPASFSLGEGFGQQTTATATDNAGNSGSGTVSGLNVDASAPTVTASITSTPAYLDFYKDNVSIDVSASDPDLSDGHAGSGLNLDPSGTHGFTATGTYKALASDNVGHATSADELSFKVDATAPTAQVTGCPTAPVKIGSSPTVTWTGSDEQGGSGVASPSSGTLTLDTSMIGTRTASATVADNVGHESPVECQYTVVYDFKGFFQPVDNLPAVNSVKAGSAVPVKFSLGGNQGLNVFATGYPTSTTITCDSTALVDAIESTLTAGNSSLSYDATTGQYNYVWKTDKAWAGTCRQLVVKFADGTIQRANFKLLK